jgi:hypothetical protein
MSLRTDVSPQPQTAHDGWFWMALAGLIGHLLLGVLLGCILGFVLESTAEQFQNPYLPERKGRPDNDTATLAFRAVLAAGGVLWLVALPLVVWAARRFRPANQRWKVMVPSAVWAATWIGLTVLLFVIGVAANWE